VGVYNRRAVDDGRAHGAVAFDEMVSFVSLPIALIKLILF
jgi:hypothetical protein